MNRLQDRLYLLWIALCAAMLLVPLARAFALTPMDDNPPGSQVSAAGQGRTDEQHMAFFENEIRPLLSEHCVQCHGDERQEAGLRLDSSEGFNAGGESGEALMSEEPDESLLLSAVRYESYEMPPSGQLPEEQIELLEQWLALGAPWPDVSGEDGPQLRKEKKITDKDRDYWAFRPLDHTGLPEVESETASSPLRNPIDRFIVRVLQDNALELAPAADRATLARRLYLDLLGVPPTPDELGSFLSDERADAYGRLVDRLLEDRRYGEKWARHWLDLVRYAESDGFNQDAERPNAYLYRDWVIEALNSDMPYDQFVRLQLAGDEIAPDDPDALVATGYLRHWIYEYNQRDAETQWSNILNDITDVTGEVFLGLGVGCARCHDHKFDPILQRDYYRLQASFASFLPRDDHLYGTEEELEEYHRRREKWESETAEIREEMAELEQPIRDSVAEAAFKKFPLDVRPMLFKSPEQRSGYEQQIYDLAYRQVVIEWEKLDFTKKLKGESLERWQELNDQLAEFEDLKPEEPINIRSAGTIDGPAPPTTVPSKSEQLDEVLPATFEVFGAQALLADEERTFSDARASDSPAMFVDTSSRRATAENRGAKVAGGRRSQLAAWINAPENALAHRVIVNRLWQHHFGHGIVRNANDFGRLGIPPTHPELLDWLAQWFLEHDRSFKGLHRLIVTSSTYRQTSQVDAHRRTLGTSVDPENLWLWRYPARRLEAEPLRDAMLVASGKLEPKAGGPSSAHDSWVRSIYTKIKRNQPHPMLSLFDAPDYSSSVGGRNVTTTPNQSLLLINAEWPLELAQHTADELQQAASLPAAHIREIYTRCYQREPTGRERDRAEQFLRERTLAADPTGTADAAESEAERSDQEQGEQVSELATEDSEISESNESDSRSKREEVQKESEPEQLASDTKWYRSASYTDALTDLCHVVFNSSEFLYID